MHDVIVHVAHFFWARRRVLQMAEEGDLVQLWVRLALGLKTLDVESLSRPGVRQSFSGPESGRFSPRKGIHRPL